MPKEYTLEGCLYCHRKLASRPRDFPQVDLEEHEAYGIAKTVMADNAALPDAQEGMSAFLERRAAEWKR